jgi:alcohol dehydrogenase
LLLPLAGTEEFGRTPPGHRARRTIEIIRSLRQTLFEFCGLPRTLKEAEVAYDKLESIAQTAVNDGSLTFNPVEVDYNDALLLLREAYE